jgi:hypothetical protein
MEAGPVLQAVRRDLEALDARVPGTSRGAAAVALQVLAVALDDPVSHPLSSRVAAARELREGLHALRASLPDTTPDRLDELVDRRRQRLTTHPGRVS